MNVEDLKNRLIYGLVPRQLLKRLRSTVNITAWSHACATSRTLFTYIGLHVPNWNRDICKKAKALTSDDEERLGPVVFMNPNSPQSLLNYFLSKWELK